MEYRITYGAQCWTTLPTIGCSNCSTDYLHQWRGAMLDILVSYWFQDWSLSHPGRGVLAGSWDHQELSPARGSGPGTFNSLLSTVVDPDPYVFGPPGSASGSISHNYGSGSFHHQAKIVRKALIITVLWLLSDPDPYDPYVFRPPGSSSGFVSHRYGSKDKDPKQNDKDPQHCFLQ